MNFAQSFIESLHKTNNQIKEMASWQKVIHTKEPLFLNKKKLYTDLSTLSTITNYSCRMFILVSRTKMRFVTYDKSTIIINKIAKPLDFSIVG